MLHDLIYIYENQKFSSKNALKNHPFSIVVYIQMPFFKKGRSHLTQFLNEFKDSSLEFNEMSNVFKYEKMFQKLIIRFPIKSTDSPKENNLIKCSRRAAYKVVDKILDFNREGDKTYINKSINLKQLFLFEETMANAEYQKKLREIKALELYDPQNDIKYATERDISKVRFELGEALFRDKIKHGKPLFPSLNLHYDNEYLYEKYVKPHEKPQKKKGG